METKKVYKKDLPSVFELFNKYEPSPLDKSLLFRKHWDSDEDYLGIKIEDQEKTIAYLGLIFSTREFNGVKKTFCNISCLTIDPAYRGQQLSYRLIQYLQTLGDFTITNITPIAPLHNMFRQNGFKSIIDERKIFWRHPFVNIKDQIELITDSHLILTHLDDRNRKIHLDHKEFNCLHLVFKIGVETCFIIVKQYSAQRRKFITNKWVNYLDFGVRKVFGLSFLNKLMESYEIHYASNYGFLCKNMNSFAKVFFKKHNVLLFSLRMEHYNAHHPKYLLKSNYYHSHQMYCSKDIQADQYDTLYSEIFILDM